MPSCPDLTTLLLALQTGRSTLDGTVSLAVAFLKSYQHMGWFEAVCEGGCSCEPLKRSGHLQQEFNVSQLHLGHMFVTVSGAPACLLACPPPCLAWLPAAALDVSALRRSALRC